MNIGSAYSAKNLKRSLLHFAAGRSLSAILGIGLLLLLVRYLPRESYGHYIALAATLEIVQLFSSLGLMVVAYRYLPLLNSSQQNQKLFQLTWTITALRVITLTAGTGIALIILTAINNKGWSLWPTNATFIFALVIIFEGTARFIDVIFDSLLLQGHTQTSILVRNGLRLGGLAWLTMSDSSMTDPLVAWITVEALSSGVGLSLSLILLHLHLRKVKAKSADTAPEAFSLDYGKIRDFVLPNYAAQVIGLAQGPDITKIIFAKIAGAVQAGAFGFAASIHSMLQRYLPVFLLIGVIRPMFVATHQQGGSKQQLSNLASMVFKLNILLLAPIFLCVLLLGPQLTSILSGGKFPEAATHLQVLSILLLLQALHAVLGILLMIVEDGWANIKACVVGLLFFTIGCVAAWQLSPAFLPAALVGAELAWCSVIMVALSKHGFSMRGMIGGYLRLALSGIIALLVGLALVQFVESPTAATSLAIASSVVIIFFISAAILKPFTAEERKKVNSLLPKPIFIW